MKRVFLSFFLFLFTLPTAFAQDGVDSINQFNVEINLDADGTVHVLEKIQYDFGDREGHGIFRYIPLIYGDDEIAIPIKIISITDENATPYVYEDSDYSYSKSVQIGDPNALVSGTHWYYIEYESSFLVNGIDDHDEFYWNVTGNEWDVEIKNVNVTLTVPNGGTKEFKYAACYTGYFGESGLDCNSTVVDKNTFAFNTERALVADEGFTVVGAFERGLVPLPAFLEVNSNLYETRISLNGKEDWFGLNRLFRLLEGHYVVEVSAYKYEDERREIDLVQGGRELLNFELKKKPMWIFLDTYLPIILFLLGSFLVLRLWFKRGKDPDGRGTIMPFYKPTDDLSPGEMGIVVDERADLRDISATIVQLAVKGYLKIEKKSEKGKDYKFIQLKDVGEDVLDFEVVIFDSLFGEKKEVGIKELQKTFFTSLPNIKTNIYEQVVKKEYFDLAPDKVRTSYLWKSFVLCLLLGFFSFAMLVVTIGPLYLILPFVGIEMFIVSFFMPRKTQLGVEVYERILGFKMFLDTAEKDRLKKLFSPKEYAEVFEKNLPYAIVLGVEKEWADQFEGLYDGVPDWYAVGGVNNLGIFISDFGDFQTSSQIAYAGYTANSGSGGSWGGGSSGGWSGGSGFGGGGFSGGGFGGGGGGRW